MKQLIWKPLIYNDLPLSNYEMSEDGQIKSLAREITRKDGTTIWKNDFIISSRTNKIQPHPFSDCKDDNGKTQSVYIARALYLTFIGPTDDYVTFKDRNPKHIKIKNLITITHSELQIRNMKDVPSRKMKLAKINKKNKYKSHALSDDIIKLIKTMTLSKIKISEIKRILNVSRSSIIKYTT